MGSNHENNSAKKSRDTPLKSTQLQSFFLQIFLPYYTFALFYIVQNLIYI